MSYGGAYSYVQQIYRASEFTAAGVPAGASIIAISFYNATGATLMSDLRTYMGHRSTEYFSGTSDWAPFNTLTLVDSGDWNAPAGWFQINFDTPFIWDGNSNVVVGVSFRNAHSDYSTNNPNCGYRYTDQGGNAQIRRFDANNISSCDPTNMAVANSVSVSRPNMKITYTLGACPSLPPMVANVGPNSADLNWINFQQSAYSWDLLYGETGTLDTLSGGSLLTGVTDTFYTLTGLTANTSYTVYLKSYCSTETGSWSAPRIFTTQEACPHPTNVTVGTVTHEDAVVSWTPGGSETGWELICVQHGESPASATAEQVYSLPYTITNLSENTQYDVYVRADCGTGEYSNWSPVVSFATFPSCTSPSNLHVSQITGTSAFLTWNTSVYGAVSYMVGWSESGQNSWTTQTVTDPYYMLSGLDPSTDYDVRVYAECLSGFSDTLTLSFGTHCLAGGDPFTEGTVSIYTVPVNNFYRYSYTQQIFLASEMGGPATIDSIAFYYNYSTDMTSKTDVTIYLGHTSQSTFTGTSNYIPATNFQQVYSGSLNCTQGWNTFVFTTPFQYNGTDNLVLALDDNSNAYNGSSYVFLGHNAGANRTLHYYSDSYNPAPSDPTAAGANSSTIVNRSNVKFFIPCDNTITCISPNVYSTGSDVNSVTLAWAPGNAETSWEMEYRAQNDSDWVSEGLVTSPHTVQGLFSDTPYIFRVRSVCGGGNYSGWATLGVRTACTSIVLPYEENFDDAPASGLGNMVSCWTTNTNSTSSYPYTSSSYHHSGGYSVYFYGTSAYYSSLASPRIDDSEQMDNIQVRFWAYKTSASYKIQVGVMSDPEDVNTFTLISEVSPSANSTWEYFEVNTSSYAGNGRYIAFLAPNVTTSYMYIDDVVIDHIPTCPHVDNITVPVATITPNSAVVTWTPGGAETEWEVVYGPAGTNIDFDLVVPEYVSGAPSITLYNLLPSTLYDVYVRAVCTSSDASIWMQASFASACDVITTFPYVQDFNNQGSGSSAFPMCWTRHQTGTTTTYPYISTTGGGSLYFYSTSSVNDYATTDPLNLSNENPGSLLLSFDLYKSSSSYGRIDVGYMTDPDSMSTFHLLKSIYPSDLTNTSTWYPFTVSIPASAYLPEIYFAFVAPTSSTTNYVYLDNVKLDYLPTCSAPSNLEVSNVAGASALLTWNEAPYGVSDYTVEYTETGTGNWQSQVVTGDHLMLTGLTELTSYDVMLYGNCGAEYSDTLTTSFTTNCMAGGSQIVGNGTLTNYHIPLNTFYNYSYVQELYLANEINASGNINSISFQYIYSTPQTKTNQSIYLAETDLNTLSDWIPFDSLTLVYNGSITYTNSGPDNWMTIDFATPFNYSGNRNLVVVVKNDHGDYTTSNNNTFKAHAASGKTLEYYDDDYVFSFTSPDASSTYAYRNNIKFGMDCDQTATCIAPNVYVDSYDATSATIAWVPGASESSWEMEYKSEGDAAWTSVGTVTSSPYELTNLSSNATYTVRLRSDCGGDNSTWATTSFTIPCYVAALPFVEDFSTATGSGSSHTVPCWSKKTNYSTAYPYPSSSQSHSSPYSLYFYGSSSYYSLAATPRFDDSIEMDSLNITFWSYKTSASYFIEVGIMSDPDNPATFESIGSFSPSANSTWERAEFDTRGYSGNGHYVAFRVPQWISNYQYVDDITIDYIPACVHVENLTASNITVSSADISWTPGSNEDAWEILYGTDVDFSVDQPETVYNPNYSITGLAANTVYQVYVRGICQNGDYSAWELMSFRTECGTLTVLPITENFDTYGTGENTYPFCWGKINTYSSDRPYINATHYAGVGSLYFYAGSSNTYNIAVMPEIDASIPVNTLQATFMYRAYYASDRLIVGVMGNPNDPTTFVPVDTIKPASNPATWVEQEVSFSQYSGTGQYIAFKNQYTTTNCYAYVDNLVIDLLPSCPKPQNVSSEAVTQNSITLSWTEQGSATEWEIEYGPVGFTPGTGAGTVENANTNPYTVNNLASSTSYDFYVKALCGMGDTSHRSSVFTFATECDPIDQLPYTDNFDTYGTGTSAYPLCWKKINTYSADRPYVNSTSYAGAGSMYFYAGTSGTYNIAITPRFDPTIPINTLQATFMYRGNSASDRLIVGVMTNPTDVSTFVPVDTVYPGSPATGWVERDVSFSHYNGSGQYVAFRNEYTTTYGYAYIDNLYIDLIPSCPKPNGLTVTGVTENTVTLSWQENGSATTWDIEYGPAGFTQGSADGTIVTATSNPYTVTGLSEATDYDFYVRSACSPTDISLWSQSCVASTTMSPTALPYTADFSDATDAWTLNNGTCANYWMRGTVSNTPALFVTNDGSTPSYNQSSTSAVAALKLFTVGTADSITITFDIVVDGESQYDYFKLFLAPPTQQFPAATSVSTNHFAYNSYSLNAYNFYANGYGTQSGYPYILNKKTTTTHVTAVMPNPNPNPTATSTALLALVWRNDPSVGYQPPATITGLSVSANGSSPVTCNVPTGLAVSNPGQTTATATWTAGGTETSWNVQYKAATASTWQSATANATSYTMTGLTPGTAYQVKVQANCGSGNTSDWTTAVSFTTANEDTPTCPAPTGLTATVDHTDVTLTWQQEPNTATEWQINYRLATESTWSTVTATTTTYTLTDLTANAQYVANVVAHCTNGLTSDESNTVTFETNNIGIEDYLSNAVTLYPNPATEMVSVAVSDANIMITGVEIYNVYGQLINTIVSTENPLRINVSGLADGMYYVRVTTDNGVVTKPFVKR